MLDLADDQIGGAVVARTFTMRGRQVKAGEDLTAEDVLSINLPNRRALVDSMFIKLYPKQPRGDRFIVGLGRDKGYNVIEGRVIAEGVSKEEAEELARS